MRRKLPPHCERHRDRMGCVRIYFRRGKGARVRLPSDPTSQDFADAYAAAFAGTPIVKKSLRTVQAGTVAALIRSYQASPEYRELRDTTRAGYSTPLRHLEETHGHRTVSGMTREGIVKHVLAPFADRPGARLALLKFLRVLIRHAIDVGMLKFDPTKGIRKPKSGEIRSWTDEEIATFHARWTRGTPQRLAFDLMLYTGQRRSDVHRMTWADIDGDTIKVVQQKTGAKLTIPLHDDLAETLRHATRNHVAILPTRAGAGRTVDGFSRFMRDAIAMAELPLDAKPHGLRKAAGRRLAEGGCTAHQIMSVLGHRSLAEAERYTRGADQAHLARAAIARLPVRNVNKSTQTGSVQFGKIVKREGKST